MYVYVQILMMYLLKYVCSYVDIIIEKKNLSYIDSLVICVIRNIY